MNEMRLTGPTGQSSHLFKTQRYRKRSDAVACAGDVAGVVKGSGAVTGKE